MRALLSVIALLCLTVTACGSEQSASGATCPDGRIRFGIEPYEDPAKLKPAYEVLANALQSKLNCKVELQVVEDYSAEVLAMRNGKLEIAQFGPLGFVFASQKANAQAVASFADAKGELTTYTAGIWVPADSPIKSVNDLSGKTVALSSPGSTSGDALPRFAFKDVKDIKVDYAGGHPEALLALKNGKVAAAEINSQQLASAKAAGTFDPSGFRQVWTSAPIPNDPITIRGDLDPKLADAIRGGLLELGPADVAKVGEFLDVTPPGPLVTVTKETYQPLFDLAAGLGLTENDV
ncbi:phosphate/phosphite/phosphonate ABC transporter substrate-binding protein [Kibdelosporangium phytohabitans]|uniref:Phosphonate ABC transporter substrate-binding protein n=1 Tax=Kibdelosporangium phytohabitans TaxID=860235 RepID=A0A0N9HR85_9PSEU|nr:phosphate/phosphite/phosphonate ABC transporter substrate-binding protein [Kibdelosporangium phytohabitans]ALG07313.1 phosphonate ABC transporter substrate-binding protein [Kibdelosporangium phytohabitans]MBE1471820.1 phosphonate transport system substrate-binding protein [Kibdelosporangium phytohabitans]